MPPVIATASGLLLFFGLLSLFGGVRGVALGIAGPLMRRIGGIGFDGRVGILVGGGLFRFTGRNIGRRLRHGRLREGLVGRLLAGSLLDRAYALREHVLGEIDLRRGRRLERLTVGARLHLFAVVDPLQRERQAPALGVDFDDLHVDDVAL